MLRYLVGAVYLLATACPQAGYASHSFVTGAAGKYAPVAMDSVRVFDSLADIDEFEWEGLALMPSEFLIDLEEDKEWVDDLRRDAGRIGANAIVVLGPGDFGGTRQFGLGFLGELRHRPGDVIAVRVLGPKN